MLLTECAAIFAVALAGGLLPLLARWSERGIHAALALSAGIFLGAVFLHLLPSLAPAPDGGDGVWLYVLAGVLGVYVLESLVLRTHDHDDLHRHRGVGYAAFLGLAVHSLTDGIGLSAAGEGAGLSGPVFLAIVAHKGFETFSLTAVFQLAEFTRGRIILFVVLFSLVAPAGVLLGGLFTGSLGEQGLGVVTALAAGTFLYVCLCELLPEVFHHREDSVLKLALLGAGIGLLSLLHVVFE